MCRFLFCVLFVFFSPLAADDFVVGTTSAYAPFVSLDEEGQYVGFDIDIARTLSQKLNKNLVIRDLGTMPTLFLALKQGKVDALIWAISITKERQEKVKMVYYQGESVTKLPLLFWKAIPEGVTSITDMVSRPDMQICVEAGSFQESVLRSVPGLTLKNVDRVPDAIMEIKYSKSTATMIDPALVEGYRAKFPELKILDVPLAIDQQSFGNGICIDKKNQELIGSIEKAILEMQNEGTIAKLKEKWGLK